MSEEDWQSTPQASWAGRPSGSSTTATCSSPYRRPGPGGSDGEPLRHAARSRLALGPRNSHSPHHRRAGLQRRAGLRHGRTEANNPELGEEDYRPEEPVSWISYLDFNAMYPAAMTLPMPNSPHLLPFVSPLVFSRACGLDAVISVSSLSPHLFPFASPLVSSHACWAGCCHEMVWLSQLFVSPLVPQTVYCWGSSFLLRLDDVTR